MQEITAPLATVQDDPDRYVEKPDFPVVALRGYDRDAVDRWVAGALQRIDDLNATRTPEGAVERAVRRFGEEVSGVLQRAHETAAQITTQSRSEAEDRLESARQEAAQIVARAADRLKELDLETDRIWEERLRIVEDARQLARQLTAMADSAAERFPPAEDTTADTADAGPREERTDEEDSSTAQPASPDAAEDPDVEATAIMRPLEASEEDEEPH